MDNGYFLLQITLLALIVNQHGLFVSCEFTFTSVAPLSIIPGSPYKISTNLETVDSDSSPISFKYEITDDNNQTVASSSSVEVIQLSKAGATKITILDVKPDSLTKDSYNLSVTATDSKGKVERDRITIWRDIRNTSMLIQTDKPIYKPGESVKFRVLLLNRFLQPFGEDKAVQISITDPAGNLIMLWKSKTIPSGRGFISEELELSKEPSLGTWNIKVETDPMSTDETTTQTFSVEEYVLPKFKVEIGLSPKFVTFEESKFTVEVSAMYSYGKPVNGECSVELKDPNQFYYYHNEPRPVRTRKPRFNIITEIGDIGSDLVGGGRRPKRRRPAPRPIRERRPVEQRPPRGITKTSKLEEGKGIVKIVFDLKSDLGISRQEATKWGKDFQLFASCTDQSSGNIRNASEASIKLYEFPYKIELVQQPNQIIPGFPVSLTIKVASHDNVPISDGRADALKIEHSFGYKEEEGIIFKAIPPNGLVHLTFEASANPKICCYEESLDVTYKSLKETLYLTSKQVSPTGTYMQIKLMEDGDGTLPVEGRPIKVHVRTSKVYQTINIFLISRGIILHSDSITGDADRKEQNVSLNLPQKSSPSTKLFVYVVFGGKEILSDELQLNVKSDDKNNLEISLSEDKVEPGSNISISLKGRPNSVVGLRAVDQSVLLLKKDNDLTSEKLNMIGDRFYSNGQRGYYHWGGGEVYQKFLQNGLGLLTNIQIDKGQSSQPQVKRRKVHQRGRQPTAKKSKMSAKFADDNEGRGGDSNMRKSAAMEDSAPSADVESAPPPAPPEVRVRSLFPETWIWEDIDNPEGSVTLTKTVPDTITSWIISGFQMDLQHGLGLAPESSKLTVFRPFFIALNLPYSVVKGEVLFLQILVHNYMEHNVKAKVTLENQEDSFKFLEAEGTSDNKMEKEVEVKPSSIASAVFPIVPNKFGVITLKVKALTKEAGDAISQTLIVRPPGIKHIQNSAILVNLLNERVFKEEKITAIFPEQRVPLADSLKVQVIGDLLGGALNNLDKLIKLPTGCAEQNMLNFVPDVVILDYLQVTGQLLPEVEAKAKRFLEQGYQRQITYMRHDGSYSAFGNSDLMGGSTWLTAYTTRAFIQAKRHILIDEKVIEKSLRFLLDQQNQDGSFREGGFVIYQNLRGGAKGEKSNLAVTAYVLLTLAEAVKAKMNVVAVEEAMASGVKFLVKQHRTSGEKTSTDVYAVNLIAYLLHYIDHPRKDDYFRMVEGLAKVDTMNGTIHWKQMEKQEPSHLMNPPYHHRRFMIWQPRVSPATVEMTSYGLLTYLLRGKEKMSDSLAIAKWLIKQRNSQGGFMSSQDTVVGITALAKFGEVINTKENLEGEVRIGLSFGKGREEDAKHEFIIGKDNRTVLQEYLIPAGNTTEVGIDGRGRGTALAQLTWTYYVEAVDLSPAFHLKAEVIQYSLGRNLDIRIEFYYNRSGKSNMAILEGSAPSGYAFDEEELQTLKMAGSFKRYEREDKGSKVQIYFESVGKSLKTLNLKAYRVYLVARHAQGVLKIYDYYDNTQTAQFIYDVPVISLCAVCRCDKACLLKQCNTKQLI